DEQQQEEEELQKLQELARKRREAMEAARALARGSEINITRRSRSKQEQQDENAIADGGIKVEVKKERRKMKMKRKRFTGKMKFRCPNVGCDRTYLYKGNVCRHVRFECGIDPHYRCVYCDYNLTNILVIEMPSHMRARQRIDTEDENDEIDVVKVDEEPINDNFNAKKTSHQLELEHAKNLNDDIFNSMRKASLDDQLNHVESLKRQENTNQTKVSATYDLKRFNSCFVKLEVPMIDFALKSAHEQCLTDEPRDPLANGDELDPVGTEMNNNNHGFETAKKRKGGSTKKKSKTKKDSCRCRSLKLKHFPYKKKCFRLHDFGCVYCDFSSISSNDGRLLKHIRERHPNRNIYCKARITFCSLFMRSVKEFRRANKGQFNQQSFHCSKCPSSHRTEDNLQRHMSECGKRFACVWCNYSSYKAVIINGDIDIKEEFEDYHGYFSPNSQTSEFLPSHHAITEYRENPMSSIEVLDATSISLKVMDQLSCNQYNILQNPLSDFRRQKISKNQFWDPSKALHQVIIDNCRPTNAVATVLDSRELGNEIGEDCENKTQPNGIHPKMIRRVPPPEHELLKPVSFKLLDNCQKRKRGRPRKEFNPLLQLLPVAPVLPDPNVVKRKRGRPRKSESLQTSCLEEQPEENFEVSDIESQPKRPIYADMALVAEAEKRTSNNNSDDGFQGFQNEDLQKSLRYLQKWDLVMIHKLSKKKNMKRDLFLKKKSSRFPCKKCSKEFSEKRDLFKHSKFCGAKVEKIYGCPYCKSYRNRYPFNIYSHIRRYHPTCRIFCLDSSSGKHPRENGAAK
ncbi:hypothetical protein QAD02_022647, partial [Eretmocerus hayati]